MLFDIATVIIIAIFAIVGFIRGFTFTLFHTLGWIIAIVITIIFGDEVRIFLKSKTSLYDHFHAYVESACGNLIDVSASSADVETMGGLAGLLDSILNMILEKTADGIASICFAIIVFFCMVIFLKLVFYIITRILSKKYNDGITGGIDGILGLCIGLLQGVIVVLIICIIIMPIAFAVSPGLYDRFEGTLNDSMIAGALYEHNPLFSFVDRFIPSDLLPTDLTNNLIESLNSGNLDGIDPSILEGLDPSVLEGLDPSVLEGLDSEILDALGLEAADAGAILQ